MFAGPNGSGKSTLKAYLPTDLLGSYLNPDEIEQGVRDRGFLDVAQHGVVAWCCRQRTRGSSIFSGFRLAGVGRTDGSSSCLELFEWTAGIRPTGGQFLLGSGCGGIPQPEAAGPGQILYA